MPVLALAFVYAGSLGAVAASLFAIYYANAAFRGAGRRAEGRRSGEEAVIQALRAEVEECARRLRELEQRPASPEIPIGPRAGLNLTKRSQALRLHRRGESPAQIAASLDIPRQEVDLLLKVHRIVIANL